MPNRTFRRTDDGRKTDIYPWPDRRCGGGKEHGSYPFERSLRFLCDSDRSYGQEAFAAFEEISALFGRDILRPDGRIDRARLAEQIFKDPQKRKQVNAITHPLTWNAVLTEAYSCGSERVVIETALPSKEFRDKCDEMWYLYTSEENRISRLMESRGYSLEKSMAIMESQASDEEFRALADAVIDNNHSQECTAAQVRELLHGREGIDT